jgi:hypothetical protein
MIRRGLLSRLTDSLKRTKDQLFQRFEEVVQQADAPEARTKPASRSTRSRCSRKC